MLPCGPSCVAGMDYFAHYVRPVYTFLVLMVAVSLITRLAPKLNTENIFTVFDEDES